MAEYRLERLVDENADSWEEFNTASPEGSLFHSLKWRQILESDPGTQSQYFLLFRNAEVIGIFPFIEQHIRYFRGLVPVSDPQCIHAILKDYSDPLAMEHVMEGLKRGGRDQRTISYVCLYMPNRETMETITTYPLFPYAEEGDMILDLTKSPPEKIWDSFSSKSGQRKFIRRFDDDGFEITEVHSRDDLKVFYRHYEDNIRHIGGKLRPFSHFVALQDTMADEIRITLLSKGSVVAGGSLIFQDAAHRTAYGSYLALNRDLPTRYHPTLYLLWDAVNWAWENHYERFSFGMQRQDESNPRYHMKLSFGAHFEPKYSKMIALTKICSLSIRYANFRERRNARQQDQISAS